MPKILCLILVLATLIGCNSGGTDLRKVCTTEYRAGVTLTLTERDTGAVITDATAVLTADGFVETIEQFHDGFYAGAHEPVGTYTLTVWSPGFDSTTQAGIVVTGHVCHLVTRAIVLSMTRKPAGTFGLPIVTDTNGDRVIPVRIGVR